MRLLTYQTAEGPAAAIQMDDTLVPASALDAPASTVRGLLELLDGDGLRELAVRAKDAEERITLADVTLCAPIPDARKIICLGLNYRDHAQETGQEIPGAPMWFAKFANSLTGSGQPIVLPATHAEYVDYEAELALVIGRTAKNVVTEDALSSLPGAMPFNDLTARDLQLENPLWTTDENQGARAGFRPDFASISDIGSVAGSLPRAAEGSLWRRFGRALA